MLPSWLVYPATLLIVWGTVDYIGDIRRGRVQPNLVTWFLWALAPLIALCAQLATGNVGSEAALTATVGLCPLLVFLAGLKRGEWKPKPFDWCCGAMAILALILWQLTGSGAVGVGLSIVADALGAVPTLWKAYSHPGSESARFFALFAVSALITLVTIPQITIVTAGFSSYIFILYAVLFVLVRFRVGERLGISVKIRQQD
jgi:hypothetical protein